MIPLLVQHGLDPRIFYKLPHALAMHKDNPVETVPVSEIAHTIRTVTTQLPNGMGRGKYASLPDQQPLIFQARDKTHPWLPSTTWRTVVHIMVVDCRVPTNSKPHIPFRLLTARGAESGYCASNPCSLSFPLAAAAVDQPKESQHNWHCEQGDRILRDMLSDRWQHSVICRERLCCNYWSAHKWQQGSSVVLGTAFRCLTPRSLLDNCC